MKKDNNGFENKETITFHEYQAWMTGLIVGKRGALPDLADWKMIKKMMDKVKAEKETVYLPSVSPDPFPYNPWNENTHPYISNPSPSPYDPYRTPSVTWCGTGTSVSSDLKFDLTTATAMDNYDSAITSKAAGVSSEGTEFAGYNSTAGFMQPVTPLSVDELAGIARDLESPLSYASLDASTLNVMFGSAIANLEKEYGNIKDK